MSIHIIFTLLLPMRDWRWLKRGLIKVWHFHHSKLCYVNCEIGLCLLRDKMKHSIVVVCPLFKAYWKQSRIFEAFQKSVAFLNQFWNILEASWRQKVFLKHFEAFLEAFLERKCLAFPVIQEQSCKFSLRLKFSNQLYRVVV